MKVKVLKSGFKMEDAYVRLSKRSKKFTIENMDVIFYPYLLIEYEVDMGDKLKRLNDKVLCLVDMFREEYSLAKSRGEYIDMDIEDNMLIPVKADRKSTIEKAPKQIYGEIMKRKKIFKIPDIKHIRDDVIYKPFYIVECKNTDEEVFHILFDCVSGDFSLLNA